MTSVHPCLEMKIIRHEFTERLPPELEEGVLYISVPFCVAVHLCFCGCGTKVILPISPTTWHFSFDGETISIKPSIGNWSLPCRSHYWIDRSKVLFVPDWGPEQSKKKNKKKRKEKKGNGFKDFPKLPWPNAT